MYSPTPHARRINASLSTFIHKNCGSYLGIEEMGMIEEIIREQYEQPELVKLGSLSDLTAEECWECQGSYVDPFG